MKLLLTPILILFLNSYLAAQKTLEERLTQNVPECKDVAVNSSSLFIEFMKQEQFDSAKIVIDFWEIRCGKSEPVFRAKMLWTIITGVLSEDQYGIDIMEYVYKFQTRLEMSDRNDYTAIYNSASEFYGYVPIRTHFDAGTLDLAWNVKEYDNALEKLYCILYSGDTEGFFTTLQQPEYDHHIIRYAYEQEVKRIKNQFSIHYTIFGGSYQPTGSARILGNHPEFGFSIGGCKNRFTYDMRLAFRWGSTDMPYHFSLNPYDTIATTYYFSGFIGLDAFYELTSDDKVQVLLLAGIAIDGFDTTPYDDFYYYNDMTYSVVAFNFNLGTMVRIFLSKQTYLFGAARYNLVNYNNDLGWYSYGKIYEDISGNWISLSIGLGGVLNKGKLETLNKLAYKGVY